ncbi:putative pyridoxal phosphate-dependent aminotransferase EpsN [Moorella thermoacetica]|uniref:Putative pyridoxal phosphate-dependent aminotransferase EpsN n=1 Tax=Neomoorella thermoacetica TaxID=1525 RepID=A0A1J5JZ98_NEOTH|nr:LegC family aminotransferase [Moorella thermoacetica]OIQ09847.1 putative pyridoxal phosphate-dependent aminotransferase EpsN [Moorella thermoacetica]
MQEIKIPLDWPNISELERDYILKALASGYVSSAGPLVREFEQRFAAYLGIGHAVAVVNGTAGLHLALKLLGIGPGDEVIVPALTFIATVNPVVYAGARPVVVDVDPRTWNIDPAAIEKAITKHTRAIIPVHLYGNPADMDAILGLAREYGLYVIEDATEALGSTYKGKKAGTFGHIGVFSFNGNKIITTGGGGMLVTEDPEVARRARILVNQGREPGETEYEHKEIGFNYRLTNLQAALGLAQLERLPEFLATKRRNAAIYCRDLYNVLGISWQQELPEAESNWWLFSILVDKKKYGLDKLELMQYLRKEGIQIRPLFKPLNWQQCYRAYNFNHCPIAEALYISGLNLPSASSLREKDIMYVIRSIKI